MTNDAKTALLAIFEKVAYVNENGQTYYDALQSALFPSTSQSDSVLKSNHSDEKEEDR